MQPVDRSDRSPRKATGLALGFAAAGLALVADAFDLIGVEGSARTAALALSLLALLTTSVTGARWIRMQQRELRQLSNVKVGSLASVPSVAAMVDRVAGKRASAVYCFGSGTETYFSLVSTAVRLKVIDSGTRVHVGVRLSTPGLRDQKLLHYSRKWSRLAREANLQIQFRPSADFDHALRGVIFRFDGRRLAALGIYRRTSQDETVGHEQPLIVLSSDDPVADQMMAESEAVLEARPSFASIEDALRSRQ